MIPYLDTSAFLKLYLNEAESDQVQRIVQGAARTVTHLITYVEVRAGLTQAVRMQRLSPAELPHQVRRFEAAWARMTLIAVDEAMVRRAGELAERYSLRGYDSVHLAAAERAYEVMGKPGAFVFAAFDKALCASAEALGLRCLS